MGRRERVLEVVGVSTESWECAARSAVAEARSCVRELRGAEIIRQDVIVDDGTITGYRVRLAVSYDPGLEAGPFEEPAQHGRRRFTSAASSGPALSAGSGLDAG